MAKKQRPMTIMSTASRLIKKTPMIVREKQLKLYGLLFYIQVVGLFLILQASGATYGSELPQSHGDQGLSTLNIRLSSKIIRPPQELVTSTLTIPNVDIARPMVGPPSKSAILEDDQRHRMVVLTAEDNGGLTAYMLDHIDLAPHVQELRQRAIARGCGQDRMSITGGLGCVAICVKDIIEAVILP